MTAWLNTVAGRSTVAALAMLGALAVVYACWLLKVALRRQDRAHTVRLARFRTADGCWGDEQLRQSEYELAVSLAPPSPTKSMLLANDSVRSLTKALVG